MGAFCNVSWVPSDMLNVLFGDTHRSQAAKDEMPMTAKPTIIQRDIYGFFGSVIETFDV